VELLQCYAAHVAKGMLLCSKYETIQCLMS